MLVLFTNRKWHTDFRLVPKSVTLNNERFPNVTFLQTSFVHRYQMAKHIRAWTWEAPCYVEPCLKDSTLCSCTGPVTWTPCSSLFSTTCIWSPTAISTALNKKLSCRKDSAHLPSLRRSRPFKVTDFGTKRKPVCHFLLVNKTNISRTVSSYCYCSALVKFIAWKLKTNLHVLTFLSSYFTFPPKFVLASVSKQVRLNWNFDTMCRMVSIRVGTDEIWYRGIFHWYAPCRCVHLWCGRLRSTRRQWPL